MKIYRLETRQHKIGPFNRNSSVRNDILDWLLSDTHPSPADDALRIIHEHPRYIFGCMTLTQLKQWIILNREKYINKYKYSGEVVLPKEKAIHNRIGMVNTTIHDKLKDKNFCVAVYTVPKGNYKVGLSKTQVVFDPTKALERKMYPLSKLYHGAIMYVDD